MGVQDAHELPLEICGAVGVGELWFGCYGGWSHLQVSRVSHNRVSEQVGLWVGVNGGASIDAPPSSFYVAWDICTV